MLHTFPTEDTEPDAPSAAEPDAPSAAEPAAKSAAEAPALLDGAVDAVKARRAALVAAGAARDAQEARMFLAMLGLDALPHEDRA